MADGVDISFIGDKELEAKVRRLSSVKLQKRVTKLGLRRSAKRIKTYVMIALSDHEDTGRLSDTMDAKDVSAFNTKSTFGYGVHLPTREDLGLSPKTEILYPYFLEYGTPRQAGTFIFTETVDIHRPSEVARIGKDIGAAIERAAAKGKR